LKKEAVINASVPLNMDEWEVIDEQELIFADQKIKINSEGFAVFDSGDLF
jgi:hypothetical protein